MSVALLVLLGLLPPFAVAVAGCIVHDIRWRRECAAANVRSVAERARLDADAAWQDERAAAIEAVIEHNYAIARRGGFVFEDVPPQYR